MADETDIPTGFEGLYNAEAPPSIDMGEVMAAAFLPQLLHEFSALTQKLVKVSSKSTRKKISDLLKAVTRLHQVDRLLSFYLPTFHRTQDNARIVGLSVSDKKFVSFLLLRLLVVLTENVRELYQWKEVFLNGNTEEYEALKLEIPGLINWNWIHEIFYELDAGQKQELFDLIDKRPATMLVFIIDRFKLKDIDSAFTATPVDGPGLAVPKDNVELYVFYLENIDKDHTALTKEYSLEKFELIQSKINSFKRDLGKLDLIGCFRYLLIAHNPHLDPKMAAYLRPTYPWTSSILYLTVLFRLFELAAAQFPYYYREGKLPETEEKWLVDKLFAGQTYGSNVSGYCRLALKKNVASAENAMLGFWNLHILGKGFGGSPVSISETIRIAQFLENITPEQYQSHVFDTHDLAVPEWQKSIWKMGTKFGRNSSEFALIYIEEGGLFIEYSKMKGLIFKTDASYILNQQWNELIQTLRESTRFAQWYYDFLFDYLLGFTITLITGGFSALVKEIAEEVAIYIVSRVIDSPALMAAPILLGARPGAANRGLPTGKTNTALIPLDDVSKFDRGVSMVDTSPPVSVRTYDPPPIRVDDMPTASVTDRIAAEVSLPTPISRSERGLPVTAAPTVRAADAPANVEGPTPPTSAQGRGLPADEVPAAKVTDDMVQVEGPRPDRRISADDAPTSNVTDTVTAETSTPITRSERGLPEEIGTTSPSPALPDRSRNPDVVTAENLSAKSEEFIAANPGIPVLVIRYTDAMASSATDANWMRFNIEWAQSNGVSMRISPDKPQTGATPRHPDDKSGRRLARSNMDKDGISREGRQAMHPVDGIINPFVDSTTSTGTAYYFGNQSVNGSFGGQTSKQLNALGLKAGDQVVIRFEGFPDYVTARPIAPPSSPPGLRKR